MPSAVVFLCDLTLSDAWHVSSARGTEGPLSHEEVSRRVREGDLSPSDQAWRDGFENWKPIAEIEELKPPAPPPSAPSPTPQKKSKKKFFIRAALFLVVAFTLGTAGWYGYQKYFSREKDLASLFPPGARFYFELSARNYSEAQTTRFKEHYTWFAKEMKTTAETPDPKRYAFRSAVAVYGAETLENFVPGTIFIVEFESDEAAKEILDRIIKHGKLTDVTPETVGEWAIRSSKDRVPILLATNGKYLVMTNSRARFDLVKTLSEDAKASSLATEESFNKSFDGIASGDRLFIAISEIVRDVHPLLSRAGGEGYTAFKRDYLDNIKSLVAISSPEGDGSAFAARLILSSPKDYFPGSPSVHWPPPENDAPHFNFAFVLPKGWEGIAEKALEKFSPAKATVSQLHGMMGSINGALSMYFADNIGKFPVSEMRAPINQFISPKYIGTAVTPWGDEYVYESNGSVYTVSALLDGEEIARYSSGSGAIWTHPDVEQLLAAKNGPAVEFKDLIKEITEVGMHAALTPGALAADRFVVGLRTTSPENAEKIAAMMKHSARGSTVLHKGNLVAIGPEGDCNALLNATVSPVPGILFMDGVFDLRRMIEGGKSPEFSTRLEARGNQAADKLSLDGKLSASLHPLWHAAILSALFREPNTPQPRSSYENPQQNQTMGQNQAALSAGIY